MREQIGGLAYLSQTQSKAKTVTPRNMLKEKFTQK